MVRPALRRGPLPSARAAYGLFLKIALPSMVEMVLVSLVGMMDTVMVAGLGTEAISAVGLTGQPRMIALCIFFGLNAGLTAVVARRKGEGRQADAGRTLRTMLLIMLALSLVLSGLCWRFSDALMHLSGAKEDTLRPASDYFRIIMLALPFNALTMAISAALRGIGHTRITMIINGVSNVVNVIFNYFLIGGKCGFPALGVSGAALASVIGIFVGFLIALFSLLRKKSYFSLRFTLEDFRFRREVLRPVFMVSSNALLEQLCLRIGFLAFARLVADLGTAAFAAHQVCIQCLNLTYNMADGLGVAGTSLVGQKLGEGRPDLSILYGKVSQRVSLLIALLTTAAVILLRSEIVAIFSHDEAVVPLATNVMILVAVFQPFQMSAVTITGCLRGSGDTKYVARVMLLCVTLIRPVLCALAIYVLHLGLYGAWFAMLVDIIVRLILVYLRFSGGKWAAIRL